MLPPTCGVKEPFMADTFLKSVEIGMRRVFNHVIGAAATPVLVDDGAKAPFLPEPPRILFLRQDRIGDVLVSIPLIRAVRQRYPDAHIGIVLGTNNNTVAHALRPWVDTFHTYRKGALALVRLRSELRSGRYDVVVDLMDNPSTTSALLMWASAAPRRFGIDKTNRGAYSHVVPLLDRSSVHIVDRLMMLMLAFGASVDEWDRHLEYRLTEADRDAALRSVPESGRPKLIVNITGSDPSRIYDDEATIRVLRSLAHEEGLWDCYVACAPHHGDRQRRICQETGWKAIPAVASFHEYACIISRANLVWTPDTSTVHLAAAFGIPSVVLFVHSNPNLLPWTPYATQHIALTDTMAISNIGWEHVASSLRTLMHQVLAKAS
jgi:ADP-heptose:LPS heptosyltransferase